jgi:ABC-type multidrug transport system fused ATPase/permease subunit
MIFYVLLFLLAFATLFFVGMAVISIISPAWGLSWYKGKKRDTIKEAFGINIIVAVSVFAIMFLISWIFKNPINNYHAGNVEPAYVTISSIFFFVSFFLQFAVSRKYIHKVLQDKKPNKEITETEVTTQIIVLRFLFGSVFLLCFVLIVVPANPEGNNEGTQKTSNVSVSERFSREMIKEIAKGHGKIIDNISEKTNEYFKISSRKFADNKQTYDEYHKKIDTQLTSDFCLKYAITPKELEEIRALNFKLEMNGK